MKGFKEFLEDLEAMIEESWTAEDGGLTMAGSDELSSINFWKNNSEKSKEELFDILGQDLDAWSWTDNEVCSFLNGCS